MFCSLIRNDYRKAFSNILRNEREKGENIITEMELIKLKRGDISLRIPKYLIPHHRFNKRGEIVE